jgi:hypothetical protein
MPCIGAVVQACRSPAFSSLAIREWFALQTEFNTQGYLS